MPDYDFAGNDDPETIIANVIDSAPQAQRIMQAFADLGFVVTRKEPDDAMCEAGCDAVCHGDGLNIDGDHGAWLSCDGAKRVFLAMTGQR